MNKLTAALLALLLISGCAFAAETQTKGYISVNTEATEEINPTVVKISFAIETRAKEANKAAELNKEESQRAINAVKELIDTKNNESIKTTSYNLNPQYSYKDGQRNLIGYIASNSLRVTLKDVEKAGKIISTALSNGANSVNGLEFIVDETNDACNKLIQKAAQGAKLRADTIAESMNTTVTGIKSLNAGCTSSQGYYSNFRAMNTMKAEVAMDSGAGAMPVEAGKTQLRAFVNGDFYVK